MYVKVTAAFLRAVSFADSFRRAALICSQINNH